MLNNEDKIKGGDKIIIRTNHFDDGKEVVCLAKHKLDDKVGCLSIRRAEEHEVYIHWPTSGEEKILLTGTLQECVKYTNTMLPSKEKDIIEENHAM